MKYYSHFVTFKDITDEHVSDYMKERLIVNEKKIIKSTIVQTYNGKQLLLMSSLIQLYMKLGMKISNVTKFIQYVPAPVFKPFTEKVVELRVQAELVGDKAKSLTSKLFGNSAYGKERVIFMNYIL